MCTDDGFCAYGERCDLAAHTCFVDTRGPFCDTCTSATIYEPHQCGPGPNFCLIKAGDLTLAPYCGVDCSQYQPCPHGYACFSVRIVYTSENCKSDDQCSSGKCFIREGDQLGFCLCTADQQCPRDNTCDDFYGECRITHQFCVNDSDCGPVFCIDGFCHIGYNCKPLEGLRCEDLTP
jgi:hypothetical protein